MTLPTEGVYALEVDPPSMAASTLLIYAIAVGFIAIRARARAEVAASARRVAAANARADLAREELARAHAAKLVALTRVGDGLHTPLARISEAAARLVGQLPEALHDHAEMVGRSAGQLLGKLDSFALYTAAWTAEPGVVEVFDVGEVVSGLLRQRTTAARDKGVELRLREHPDLGARVGDRARLGRILAEVLDNAVKYTAAGHVSVDVHASSGDRVTIAVSDTGAGIPAADRERVFEPLFRGDASSTQRVGGTGLGLAVARRLAEGLGGSLDCDAEVADGTRMVLTLPLPVPSSEVAS